MKAAQGGVSNMVPFAVPCICILCGPEYLLHQAFISCGSNTACMKLCAACFHLCGSFAVRPWCGPFVRIHVAKLNLHELTTVNLTMLQIVVVEVVLLNAVFNGETYPVCPSSSCTNLRQPGRSQEAAHRDRGSSRRRCAARQVGLH